MLEISIKAPSIETIKTALGKYEKQAPAILARVLNRTITNVQKNVTTAVKENYIVKSADVKKTLNVSKASKTKLNAQVKSAGKRILLYDFRVSPKDPRPSKPPKAYKAKVLKKSALKPVSGGFVAQMKSGHTGLFKRLSGAHTPIKELVGASVPQMIGNKTIIKRIEKEAQNTINKRLKHELKRIINP